MGIKIHLNGEKVSQDLFAKMSKAYHANTHGVVKSISLQPEGKFDVVINHDVAKREGKHIPSKIGEIILHNLLNYDINMEPLRREDYNNGVRY
jgi:hypothetical protein